MSDAPDQVRAEAGAMDPADQATLHDPRLARASLVAGLIALPLAVVVVGFIPAAIGLHAALSHLRFRLGSRPLAYAGLVTSGLAAALAALGAVTWGAILLTVLLTRSALEQARNLEGHPIGQWSVVDVNGAAHASGEFAGRIHLIEVTVPGAPFCDTTMRVLGRFAANHPEVAVLSWSPDADEASMRSFAAANGANHLLAVGRPDQAGPLAGLAAKPGLFVVDAEGMVRHVILGPYDDEGLAKLVAEAAQPAPIKPVR